MQLQMGNSLRIDFCSVLVLLCQEASADTEFGLGTIYLGARTGIPKNLSSQVFDEVQVSFLV